MGIGWAYNFSIEGFLSVDKSLSSLGDFTCTLPVSSLGKRWLDRSQFWSFALYYSYLQSLLDIPHLLWLLILVLGLSVFFHLGEILAKLDFGLPGLVGMVYWIGDCTCWTSSLVVVPLTVLSVWNSRLAVLSQHQYPLFKSLVFMRGHSGSGSDNGLQ